MGTQRAHSLKSMTLQALGNAQNNDLYIYYKRIFPKAQQDQLEVVFAVRVNLLEASENHFWMSQLVFDTNHIYCCAWIPLNHTV